MTYKCAKKSDFWTVVDGICRLLSSGVHAKSACGLYPSTE